MKTRHLIITICTLLSTFAHTMNQVQLQIKNNTSNIIFVTIELITEEQEAPESKITIDANAMAIFAILSGAYHIEADQAGKKTSKWCLDIQSNTQLDITPPVNLTDNRFTLFFTNKHLSNTICPYVALKTRGCTKTENSL